MFDKSLVRELPIVRRQKLSLLINQRISLQSKPQLQKLKMNFIVVAVLATILLAVFAHG